MHHHRFRRNDDNRDMSGPQILLDLRTKLQAVFFRHHNIAYHQIRQGFCNLIESIYPVLRFKHIEIRFEMFADIPTDIRIIFGQ